MLLDHKIKFLLNLISSFLLALYLFNSWYNFSFTLELTMQILAIPIILLLILLNFLGL